MYKGDRFFYHQTENKSVTILCFVPMSDFNQTAGQSAEVNYLLPAIPHQGFLGFRAIDPGSLPICNTPSNYAESSVLYSPFESAPECIHLTWLQRSSNLKLE